LSVLGLKISQLIKKDTVMSKRVGKSGTVVFLSSIVGLMTSCGPPPQQTVNVKPIPVPVPSVIAPTPLPGSSLLPVLPGPGQTPLPPGATPANPLATPTPIVAPGQLAIASSTLPTAALSFTYNAALTAVGGSGSYRWNIASGSLPNGLILDQATGQIFGKPTQTGTFSFEIQAIDTAANAARRSMFILVSDTNSGINSVGILTTTLVSGSIDRRYSQTINASGGTAPYSWSISSGALPDGLAINASTGEISGTPTLQSEETFTVKVVDARGQAATKALSITINRTDSNIAILTANLPIGLIGKAYDQRQGCDAATKSSGQLTSSGGDTTTAQTWEVSSGTLPSGLTLSSTGLLSGTPTGIPASYTFTVRVSDKDNNRASKVFTVDTQDMLIYSFSPQSGGEGLKMVVQGENFGTNANTYNVVFSGGIDPTTQLAKTPITQATVAADTTTDANCHRLTLQIPANAATGALLVKNTSTSKSANSTIPFFISDVVINEVFTNPDNSSNQFVELLNKGSSSASIAGWHLRYTDVNGSLTDFTIPAETPPLAPGAVTVINISKAGGNSASNLYTGTSLAEMLFLTPTPKTTSVTTAAGGSTTTVMVQSTTGFAVNDYVRFSASGEVRQITALPTASSMTVGVALTATLSSGTVTQVPTPVIATLPQASISQIALCTNDLDTKKCTTSAFPNTAYKDTNYRDFIQFGPDTTRVTALTGPSTTVDANGVSPKTLVDGAVASGIWATANDSVDVTKLLASLDPGLAVANAHNGTNDGTTNRGLQLKTGEQAYFAETNTVVIDNSFSGGKVNRLKRTVANLVGAGTDRLTIDQPLFTSTIQSTNTGTGAVNNGLLVDKISDTFSSLTVSDFVNVLSGTTICTVPLQGLKAGPRIELSGCVPATGISAAIQAANTSDGTSASGGFLVNQSAGVTGATTVSITMSTGTANAFTVVRNLVSTPDATHVVLDQPLASAPVSATNTGDGTSGNGATVTSATNFITNRKVLFNGQTRLLTVSGSNFELRDPVTPANFLPIAQMNIDAANTGTGAAGSEITVAATTGFNVGDTVRINGLTRKVASLLSTPARVQLDQPVSMTITNTTGDGTTGNGVGVSSTQGFATGNQVRIAGLSRTITPVGSTLELNNPIFTTITNANAGDGSPAARITLDITNAGTGTTNNPSLSVAALAVGNTLRFPTLGVTKTIISKVGNSVELSSPLAATTVATIVNGTTITVASTGGFAVGDKVRFGTSGTIATIQSITSPQIVFTGAVAPTVGEAVNLVPGTSATLQVNLVPTAGTIVMQGDGVATNFIDTLNLVPTTGSFTLVPFDPTQDLITQIPTSGKVWLAPNTGNVKKFLSIKYSGSGNTTAGLTATTGPTAGVK
jgi:hypothetical protein